MCIYNKKIGLPPQGVGGQKWQMERDKGAMGKRGNTVLTHPSQRLHEDDFDFG